MNWYKEGEINFLKKEKKRVDHKMAGLAGEGFG